MKTAIVLGGTSAHIPLIDALRRRGYRVVLVDYHERPVAAAAADAHVRISTLDARAVLDLARRERVALVISTAVDQANVTACHVAEQLGLCAPYSLDTALLVTDKARMKQRLLEHGIPTARHVCIEHEEEALHCGLALPVVVKPTDGCGSKGVRLAIDDEDLRTYARMALATSRSHRAIVEEFHEGREICVDGFVQDGRVHVISIYEKFNLIGSTTVIQCFRSIRPVSITPGAESTLHAIADRVARAFGLHCTSLFIQTIVAGDTVTVIELAARLPGGLAYRATELTSGFDVVAAIIDSYLGLRTTITYNTRPQVVRTTNSIYGRPGILGRVAGQEELRASGIIEEFCCYKTAGMTMSPELSSADRVGGFLVVGRTRDEVFLKTRAALRGLEIYDGDGRPVMIRDRFLGVTEQHIRG